MKGRLEWNAEKEQWEFDGQRIKGEILFCDGWHDGLNVHDPFWCAWKTERELLKRSNTQPSHGI